jgi:predicted Holliday junction resolvase-like endonuclease|tara:strand:- start:11665 stop:12231 length:567 start_codon:yes stop_codon:yes gene_type:complete
MLWLWIVIIAEVASIALGIWYYFQRVKGLETKLQEETLALAVSVEGKKHLEEQQEFLQQQIETLRLDMEDSISWKDEEIQSLKNEVRHQKGRAQSAHSSKGQILEKWTPFLNHDEIDEAWKPQDWSFLGNPLDYVVWEWYQDKEKNMAEGKVVLLDVKAAKSQLTTKQRRIRDLIKAGRVEWREIRLD